ncbi:MAG: hypothetical protein ACE5OZ_18980 [Candidatus Heimdallarchaeota archaeon]
MPSRADSLNLRKSIGSPAKAAPLSQDMNEIHEEDCHLGMIVGTYYSF